MPAVRGHVVVAAGYEPDKKRVLIADRDEELHPVDWDVLEQARGSMSKPFPPRHEWYTFDFAGARPPTVHDVREAISDVCRAMLEPPIANLGVEGIRKAQRETRKWPQLLDGEKCSARVGRSGEPSSARIDDSSRSNRS